MSVLALKALAHGAESLPDKFFEKLPGNYFVPPHKQDNERGRKARQERRRSEQKAQRRASRRDRSPSSDSSYSSSSDDTDRERDGRRKQNKKDHRQARSISTSTSRSSRDRRNTVPIRTPSRGYDSTREMSQAGHAGYGQYDHRSSYGYDSQVGRPNSSRRTTTSTSAVPRSSLSVDKMPSMSSSPLPFGSHSIQSVPRGSPRSNVFPPSCESPFVVAFRHPFTDSPKPSQAPQHDIPPSSSSAARYTPGPGYAPSPMATPIPHPPVGAYAPYNPADYAPTGAGYQAPGNAYPSPPPLNRQRSNSQPSAYSPYAAYPAVVPLQPVSAYAPYDDASSRRESTSSRRKHRHRARSVDSQSRHGDDHRDNSRMAKVRERFDNIDPRERGLAATVGGALAGGLAGRQFGKSRLTALAGAAAGALGGRAFADKKLGWVFSSV